MLLMCRLLKDDTFADASYILEMMTQVCSHFPFVLINCGMHASGYSTEDDGQHTCSASPRWTKQTKTSAMCTGK